MHEEDVRKNPIETKCISSTCGGMLVLIYISVNLRSQVFIPLNLCDVL